MKQLISISSKRAILLFTRAPENEARHKPLSGRLSFAERVGLYESFMRHVLAQTSALDYPILVATDEPEYNFARHSPNVTAVFKQHGDSFGDKLSHALQFAFAQGYDEVVCVGNDCLELFADDLKRAFAQLATQALVLGAARDGGVYLIGMRRESLESARQALAYCHWQTRFVLAHLQRAAETLGLACATLAQREDVDTAEDLLRASRRLPALIFLRKFAHHIASPFHPFAVTQNRTPVFLCVDPLRFQKAPPAFVHAGF